MSVVTVLSFRLWRPVLQGLGAESFLYADRDHAALPSTS